MTRHTQWILSLSLARRHVDFNDVDRGGDSPLHIAVKNGRAINAEILLRTAKEKAESNEANDQIVHQKFGLASINRMNKSRFYPLHLAVLNNHLVGSLLSLSHQVHTKSRSVYHRNVSRSSLNSVPWSM